MHVNLPFGGGTIHVDIPDNWLNGRCYRPRRFESAGDEHAEVLHAVDNLIGGSKDFPALLAGRSSVAIAIDSAYPSLFNELIPVFLECIEDHSNLRPDQITLVLSNTLWNPKQDYDVRLMVPSEITNRYNLVLHDPKDKKAVVRLGETDVILNRAFAEADLKIVVSCIVPHMIYGFTGPGTVLTPGLTYEKVTKRLHGYESVSHPLAVRGCVDGNPFTAQGKLALEAADVSLAVCCPVTPEGRVSEVYAGEPEAAWMEAVGRMRELMAITVKEPMDIVVAASGGLPHDSTMLKLIDALCAVEPVLKPDGTIVMVAELSMGFGPTPLREMLLGAGGLKGFCERFESGGTFLPGQWVAQRFFELLSRHEVILYSQGIEEDALWTMGMTPTNDMQEAILGAMQEHGQRCKICALPDGPFGLARIQTAAASNA
ncbi:MAG: lactate racemase domain-containing protein [Sumerlaeia bacterium]